MKRLDPQIRKAHILAVGVNVARTEGYHNVTRGMVADAAEISAGLVNVYFKTVQVLKDAIMEQAISQKVPEIIAVGLAIKDPIALGAPQQLKDQAAKHISH